MSNRFLVALEKFLGNKLPKFIKTILINSGFDNQLSILSITSDTITEIESFVKQFVLVNKDLLKETAYKNVDIPNFKFLPGHRDLLLSLPKRVSELNKINIEKKSKKSKVAAVNSTQLEKSPNSLQDILIAKLNKIPFIKSAPAIITKNSILDFSCESVPKCKVRCPLCEKIVPCIYNKYWVISNVSRHGKLFHNNSSIAKKSVNETNPQAGQMDQNSNPNSLANSTTNNATSNANIEKIEIYQIDGFNSEMLIEVIDRVTEFDEEFDELVDEEQLEPDLEPDREGHEMDVENDI